VGTNNQKLFDTQILTVYNDIEKAIEKLKALAEKRKRKSQWTYYEGKSSYDSFW
jgi:hypothetical protein